MADGRFYNFDNDPRVYVSVTTFLGIIGKQQYLMPWAAKMERELIVKLVEQLKPISEILEYLQPKQPYGYQLSNEVASEFGNKIHKAIDYTLKGLKLPRLTKAERKVYDKWLEWWNAQGFTLNGAEQVVKSERWGYAGTLDADVTNKAGSRLILDWKTGKNHYDEHDYQNLAYQKCLYDKDVDINGGQLVYIRPDKEVDDSHIIPPVSDALMEPVYYALGLWRAVNKKPWKEN